MVAGLLGVASLAVASLDPGGTFGDDNGSIHEGAIEAIAAEGITRGCNPPTNDLFCPSASVTREQMATFLVRALDLPAGSSEFDDIAGSVHAANIAALAEAGITKGCNPPDNTLFCPQDQVTREQMATFLVRALNLPGGTASFVDTGSSVHAANISALAEAGITKGCNPPDNTMFCPNDPVTREQMATFLTRALDLDAMVPPPPLPDDVPGDSVFIGTSNWLYLQETIDPACVDQAVFDRLIEELEKAGTVASVSGRDFAYAVAPNKATMYPENVPDYVGSCAEENSTRLQTTLLAAVDPNRIMMWEALDAATEQLYFKHDTHWNIVGQLVGSERIADVAAPGVWDQLALVATPSSRQGDLASAISFDWVIDYDEQTPTLSGVDPTVEVLFALDIAGRPLVTYSSPSHPVLSDVNTAIIHDSFGMFFRNKLGPLFEDATFLPTFSHPIPDAAASYVTDSRQIVVEVVERNILRDFLGTGTAGMLAAVLADDFSQTAVDFNPKGESVGFTIPAGPAGALRYLIVELDTSALTGPFFIDDSGDYTADGDAWPDELTADTSRYGFEIMVDSGSMELPLPSSVTVDAAYVVVIE